MVPFQKKHQTHESGQRNEVERLSLRLKELEALNRIAGLVGATTDFERTLKTIIEEVRTLTHAMLGSISVVDESSLDGMTTLVRGERMDIDSITYTVDRSLTGWVLEHKKPLVIEDLKQDQRFSGFHEKDYGIQTVLSVPLVLGGNVIGSMNMCNKRDGTFTDDDIRLVSIIASQSAPVIESARLYQKMYKENVLLKKEVGEKYQFSGIIGRSRAMRSVFALLERIISSEANVIIQGESGTGKELIAKAIHFNGSRREKPFIPIDCGAIPENLLESELFGYVRGAFTGATMDKSGLFQEASGGTLFLDEISNMGQILQSKLLRVLQEQEVRPLGSTTAHKVDVRVISASSYDLKTMVSQSSFRKDLFFRLNVVTIDLPPLRQRIEDIQLLAHHFLQEFGAAADKELTGFASEAIRMLEQYDWPGNVRELENVVERSVVLAGPQDEKIGLSLLPEEIRASQELRHLSMRGKTLKHVLREVKCRLIADYLRMFEGNKTKVAKALGISRQGLLNMINELNRSDKNIDI
jgi:transcriptional regulator with GAF, ATPase, and Fis domain